MLGMPNENYGSRTRALGWTPLGPLQWLLLPLCPERLMARKLGTPWLGRLEPVGRWWRALAVERRTDRRIEVQEVSTADQQFDCLWRDARSRLAQALVRDRSWVAWRYLSAPGGAYRVLLATRSGEPVGYAACSAPGVQSATIADVFAAPGDSATFTALVQATVGRATASGADSIRTLATAGSWAHRELLRAGFFRSRHAFGVHYVPLDPLVTASGVGAASDWYLLGGDFDVV